ncbi:MAG TPA: hypothetical protein VNK04_19550 [Gemmataceae bacterium]|nr:hypothetical protein [Gemmataceae bacterium]
MTRRIAFSLLVGLFGVAVLLAADDPPGDQPEPPVRLKRKARPAAEPPAKEDPPAAKEEPKARPPEERPATEKPPMPGEKKRPAEDEPPIPAEPEMDEQELLARVSRNMRTSEDRLANKELGEPTRQLQRDILEDLDKLINKLNQQQSGGGASSFSAPKQRGQQVKGSKSSSKQVAQGQRQQKQGGPAGSQQAQRNRGNQEGQAPNQMAGPGTGNTPGAGGKSPEGPNKLADIYKDVWGHLPETLRAEMNAYSRQEYMAKYAEAIKQYYATVAEKGRRKGD